MNVRSVRKDRSVERPCNVGYEQCLLQIIYYSIQLQLHIDRGKVEVNMQF